MIRSVTVLKMLWIGSLALANPDTAVIKEILGTYPIVEFSGSPLRAGRADIVDNGVEVGVVITPLKMSSQPAPTLVFTSPVLGTVFKKDANGIYQTYEKGAEQTRIDYLFRDGYLAIDASQCGADHCVKDLQISLSRGGAPGTKVDTLSFLGKVRGDYSVLTVGGASPSPETNTAQWVESEEPGIEDLRFPYCQPSGCDPGFINIKQSNLAVFQNGSVYTLIVNTGTKILHYSWEEKTDGTYVFTNYQFKLLTKEIVALEFVLKRT